MTDAARRLAAVRSVRRGRADAPTAGDAAYAVYAVLLVLAVVGVPVVRAVVLGLSTPEVLAVLTTHPTGYVAGLGTGLLLGALVLLGQVRGPALLGPFAVVAVASTDLPRRTTLRRPFLAAGAVLTTALVSVAAVLAAALGSAGATWPTVLLLVVGAAALGVLATVVWLLGQRLDRARAASLAGALVGVAAAQALVPAIWPASAPSSWAPPAVALLATSGLVAAATMFATAVPRLLDGLEGAALLAQARRWEAVGTSTSAGDLSGALAHLRALPRAGRSRWAVRGRSALSRIFLRDVVGALRTPARCAGAALALVGAGAATAVGLALPLPLGSVVAAGGAVVAFLALGVFSDGLRHAVDTSTAPALYRHGTAALCALHAVLPTACAVVLTGLGAGVATAVVSDGAGAVLSRTARVAALGAVLVVLRLRECAKGPLPPVLLTPVSTPVGDVSVVTVLLWQADAVILSALAAAAVSSTPGLGSGMLALLTGAVGGLLTTAHRLRRW